MNSTRLDGMGEYLARYRATGLYVGVTGQPTGDADTARVFPGNMLKDLDTLNGQPVACYDFVAEGGAL